MLTPRETTFPLVLLDMDTQVDFLEPTGKRPVANLDVVENLRDLFKWAREHQLTVISSMDVHRITDPRNHAPLHCMEGTSGIDKMPFTLMPRRILVQTDNTVNLPHDLLTRYLQAQFVKRGNNLTSNVKADRLLCEIPASGFVMFGVGLEESIRVLALSLMARKKEIWLVSDACGYWDAQAADLAARQIAAKGARLVSTQELIKAGPPAPPPREVVYRRRSLRQNLGRPKTDSASK